VKPPRRDTRALSPAEVLGGKAPLRLAAQKSRPNVPSVPIRSVPESKSQNAREHITRRSARSRVLYRSPGASRCHYTLGHVVHLALWGVAFALCVTRGRCFLRDGILSSRGSRPEVYSAAFLAKPKLNTTYSRLAGRLRRRARGGCARRGDSVDGHVRGLLKAYR
jgi:hypothetical protein